MSWIWILFFPLWIQDTDPHQNQMDLKHCSKQTYVPVLACNISRFKDCMHCIRSGIPGGGGGREDRRASDDSGLTSRPDKPIKTRHESYTYSLVSSHEGYFRSVNTAFRLRTLCICLFLIFFLLALNFTSLGDINSKPGLWHYLLLFGTNVTLFIKL